MDFNHIKDIAEINLKNYGGRTFINALDVMYGSSEVIKSTVFNDVGKEYSEEEACLIIMILLYKIKKSGYDVKRLFATYMSLKWELIKETDKNAD